MLNVLVSWQEVKVLILRLVLCQINGKFVGVHVSFLMIDHVQNQSIFLIAENIYTWVNALVTCILFPQELYKPLLSIRKSYSEPVSECSVEFRPCSILGNIFSYE